jgi:hypothetical protein
MIATGSTMHSPAAGSGQGERKNEIMVTKLLSTKPQKFLFGGIVAVIVSMKTFALKDYLRGDSPFPVSGEQPFLHGTFQTSDRLLRRICEIEGSDFDFPRDLAMFRRSTPPAQRVTCFWLFSIAGVPILHMKEVSMKLGHLASFLVSKHGMTLPDNSTLTVTVRQQVLLNESQRLIRYFSPVYPILPPPAVTQDASENDADDHEGTEDDDDDGEAEGDDADDDDDDDEDDVENDDDDNAEDDDDDEDDADDDDDEEEEQDEL